ncbi:MAG: hypothetical protein A2W20_00650 [Candidatus Aminicenantes bacterium RBG_16_66_30]|nr:MAG: hypothetical protein A2W20_00650 [Candidatus Aminicenantes bacterium RBG_16_66_30]
MIREGTGKGFRRGLRSLVAGALLLAGLALAGPAPPPAWWEVRLTVAVKGTYSLRGEAIPLSGEYAGLITWEGRLEPDGDDFILVHIRSEALEWSLREKAGQGGAVSVLDAPDTSRPRLRLNYVLREDAEVALDFEFEGTTVPLHKRSIKIPLEMPRSARPAGITPGYRDFVLSGSNRIVLPASDLERPRPERTFAWTWRRVERLDKDSRTFVAIQGHSAEAVVALVRH